MKNSEWGGFEKRIKSHQKYEIARSKTFPLMFV